MVKKNYDGTLIFDTKIDSKNVLNAQDTIGKSTARLTAKFAKLGLVIASAFSLKKLIDFGKESIQLASDLEEVQNVVDVAFGSMKDKCEDFAQSAMKNFGLSETTAKKMASTYMSMAKGMGIAEGIAADMSIELTKRSADMASFYNLNYDEVETKLKSVFTGETESLKSLGIVMTQTNLKNFALSKGIKQNIQDLDQATLTQLRYAYVMEQSSLAAGDFARTSGSWANQTKLLNEQFNQLKTIMGTALIQVLTPFIQYLNTIISQLITIADKIRLVTAHIFGEQKAVASTSKDLYSTVDAQNALTDAIEETNKEQKKSLAGFDEINQLADDTAKAQNATTGLDLGPIGGTTGEVSTGISISDQEMDDLERKFNKIATFGGLIAGTALLVSGIISFNPVMILAGLAMVAGGFAYGKESGELETPSWINTVTTWGLMIVGVGLLLFGICTGTISCIVAGAAALAIANMSAKGGGLKGTPTWVEQVISWGLMIVGVALLVLGIVKSDPMLMIAGVVSLMTGFSYGDRSGAFEAMPVWLNQIITWGMMALGVALIIFGIVSGGDPVKILAGAALIGASVAYGASSGAFAVAANKVKELCSTIKNYIINGWNSVKNFWNTHIAKIFTASFWSGKINSAKNGLSNGINAIKNLFTGLWNGIKGVINSILGGVESMANGIVSAVNKLIGCINALHIDVPSALQGIVGFSSFGFNLKTVPTVKIPRLATGTVVPANYGEFLSILGDNKREPEVVSPVSTMKQAFLEAIKELGLDVTIENIVELDGEVVARKVIKKHNEIVSRTGRTPLKGV